MEFVNPVFMAAGGALVSAPIIIHLINRMRFKRVRWAAMEFLLKSQKRNRRKLIIEQLILLALRCLLVLLAGLLLARFQYGGGSGAGSYHYVVIDDTPSMGDQWRTGEVKHTSLEAAKDQVEHLADSVADARTRQDMRVVLLSDLDKPLFEGPVDKTTAKALRTNLKDVEPKSVPISPLEAVKKAKEVLTAQPRGKKVFHFFSDFREHDWNAADKEELTKNVQALTDNGAHVDYVDLAEPFRPASGEGHSKHPNLALVDLRAQTTVCAAETPVEFTVGIQNYGTQPKNSFLHVYSRGIYLRDPDPQKDERGNDKVEAGELFQERQEGSITLDALPAGQRTDKTFTLLFQKKQHNADLEVKPDDKPEDRARKRRADAEFVQVRVEIDDNPADQGLAADNVRDIVVEVRTKVPTLVVDGNPTESRKSRGDLDWLEPGLLAAASYEIEYCTLEDLHKVNLNQYPNVLLLNVPQFKDPHDLDNLKNYVAGGGSVAFFLGGKDDGSPAIDMRYYNNTLFDQTANDHGEHLFPLKLDADLPPNRLLPRGEEEEDKRAKQMQTDPQQKILFPNQEQKIIKPLVQNQQWLRFLRIDAYYKARPVSEWDPGEKRQSEDVVVLPNRSGFDELKGGAADHVAQAVKLVNELAADEANKPEKEKKFTKYVPVMDRYKRRVLDALAPGADNPLFRLTKALEDIRKDQGVKDNPELPNMPELWSANPALKELGKKIDSDHDRILFGDPLVVTRPYGRGRVLAFLTSPGTSSKWNEWASGFCNYSYPIFMKEMQRYLISEADVRNRTLQAGAVLALDPLDHARYDNRARVNFMPQPTPKNAKGEQLPPKGEMIEKLPDASQGQGYLVQRTPKLGVFTFEVFPNKDANAGQGDPELQAYAYNLDALAESDLARATKETLTPQKTHGGILTSAGVVALRSPANANYDEFKEPPPELSTSIWLFLFLLAVFAAEQAMAVHLSFHLRQSEAAGTPAPGHQPAAA
jgi:hypothetical protein